ncbi:hypothetical protein F4810DRAFT_716207 [Camillea tinctor]|nr:hypothetical protein F4810DRAFT_716207 [Camillea tinctor]
MRLAIPRDEPSGSEVEGLDSKSQGILVGFLFSYLIILAICWALIVHEIRCRQREVHTSSGEERAVEEGGRRTPWKMTGITRGNRSHYRKSVSSWASSSIDSALYTEEHRPGRPLFGQLTQKVAQAFKPRQREKPASQPPLLPAASETPLAMEPTSPHNQVDQEQGLNDTSRSQSGKTHGFANSVPAEPPKAFLIGKNVPNAK